MLCLCATYDPCPCWSSPASLSVQSAFIVEKHTLAFGVDSCSNFVMQLAGSCCVFHKPWLLLLLSLQYLLDLTCLPLPLLIIACLSLSVQKVGLLWKLILSQQHGKWSFRWKWERNLHHCLIALTSWLSSSSFTRIIRITSVGHMYVSFSLTDEQAATIYHLQPLAVVFVEDVWKTDGCPCRCRYQLCCSARGPAFTDALTH